VPAVKLISNKALREFAEDHPLAEEPLQSWRHIIEHNTFQNYAELRQAFRSVDKVGEQYVFNVGGNKFRLIATIAYRIQTVWVKHVLTHAEYDKGAWK
jgi:mRNA interferase HigB